MTSRKESLRKLQRKIGEILDDFLDYMKLSVVLVEVESFRRHSDCLVALKLYKCRSCPRPFIRTNIKVSSRDDLGHLATYFQSIYNQWRLFHPSDITTDSERENKGNLVFSLLVLFFSQFQTYSCIKC